MSRFLLLTLLVSAAFVPARASAQENQDNGQGYGYGAFLTQETTQEGNVTKHTNTYHIVSQYDPVLKALLNKTGPQLDKNGNPIKKINLLPLNEQFLYFVRTKDTKPNEAVLRMVTPVAIDGCANILPPIVTRRQSGRMIAFKIEPGVVALDKTPVYAHFQCHSGSNTASADLVLKRDELIANNVTNISFQTIGGGSDTYNLELKGDKLNLVPRTAFSFKPFAGTAKVDPLSYTFYPDNIVILYAPSAPKNDDITAEIVSLAQKKGLTESAELKNGPGLYFVDPAGTLAGSLAFDANAYVGTVVAHETYQGTNGPFEQDKQVDVYAKRPGLLD